MFEREEGTFILNPLRLTGVSAGTEAEGEKKDGEAKFHRCFA